MSGLYTSHRAAAIGLRRELRDSFPGVDFHVSSVRTEAGNICFTVEYRQYDVLLEDVKSVAEPFVWDIYVPVEDIFSLAKVIEQKHVVTEAGELINMAEHHSLVYKVI